MPLREGFTFQGSKEVQCLHMLNHAQGDGGVKTGIMGALHIRYFAHFIYNSFLEYIFLYISKYSSFLLDKLAVIWIDHLDKQNLYLILFWA